MSFDQDLGLGRCGKISTHMGFFVGITWDFLHRGHDRIVGCNEVIGRNNPIVITLTGSDEIRVKRDAVFDEDKEMKVAGCLVVPVMLGSASS